MTEEVEEPEFLDLMRSHAFVLCVEGGGFDPSPKAWQSIEQGVTLIVRPTAATEPYGDLPVTCVDEWSGDVISMEKLTE